MAGTMPRNFKLETYSLRIQRETCCNTGDARRRPIFIVVVPWLALHPSDPILQQYTDRPRDSLSPHPCERFLIERAAAVDTLSVRLGKRAVIEPETKQSHSRFNQSESSESSEEEE